MSNGGDVRVIAFANQKGGVAKTTTAANVAAALGADGKRVLAIDVDPQFRLSVLLGDTPGVVLLGANNPGADAPSLLEVLTGKCELSDAIAASNVPGVDIVPSRRELSGAELALVSQVRREEFLRRAIDGQVQDYDFVLLDTPPNLGLLTVNALCAAREVVAPVSMVDAGAVQGAAELRGTIETLQANGIPVRIVALLRTLVDRRRLLYRAIRDALPRLELPQADTEIPMRADVQNSENTAGPVVVSAPDSLVAYAYRAFASELTGDRGGLRLVA